MLSTDKLRDKVVINIEDGKSRGYVSDIEVNLENGVIEGIVIHAEKRMFSIFGDRQQIIVVKWEKVRTVGEDVILVELDTY